MPNLADRIEQYIKEKLARDSKGQLEIQRGEIAQFFSCAPSQINYVLSTRFNPEQGYLVESRRGGGGYLKIIRLSLSKEKELAKLIQNARGRLISQQTGEGLLERLYEEGFLSRREREFLKAAINRETLALKLPERDLIRGRIIEACLKTLLREDLLP